MGLSLYRTYVLHGPGEAFLLIGIFHATVEIVSITSDITEGANITKSINLPHQL